MASDGTCTHLDYCGTRCQTRVTPAALCCVPPLVSETGPILNCIKAYNVHVYSFHTHVLIQGAIFPCPQVKRVFASLANGRLCVFSRKSMGCQQGPIGDADVIPEACMIKCDEEQFREEAQDWADPLILKLAEVSRSAKCMVFVGSDQLWCGCGNTITVVDSINLKVLHNIPVFVKKMALVNELVSDGVKVWGVGRQLSCVMEWDAKTYTLQHIFNCNEIDPTGEVIISDPKSVEDLIDPDNKDRAPTTPADDRKNGDDQQPAEGFTVQNDPVSTTCTSHAPFSQRRIRSTLRLAKGRPRGKNITREGSPMVGGGRSRLDTLRNRVRRRQQGSTRTTSLVLYDHTLWVGRGMGDVLVIDVTGDKSKGHGRVIARLASEDSEKFGNRSYHKLVCVAGEYVCSSQWLEPVDVRRPSAVPTVPANQIASAQDGPLSRVYDEAPIIAHQAITVWEAWTRERIEQFMRRRSAMLMQEEDDV